ncbi:MAG: phage tail protein [Synergistaceae bacterium]|jgi:P2-related tail formation protein|nr:phage tail protein [Synergistaceae bacterium]
MGQIIDLIPSLYHGTENELTGFVEQTEPEIERIQEKIKGITALINVDRCPDKFLPYLAALTNVPIIGENPTTWRKQIRNWPYLLKHKGTAWGFNIFLDSLGISESSVLAQLSG